jgi:hypothetical protein
VSVKERAYLFARIARDARKQDHGAAVDRLGELALVYWYGAPKGFVALLREANP